MTPYLALPPSWALLQSDVNIAGYTRKPISKKAIRTTYFKEARLAASLPKHRKTNLRINKPWITCMSIRLDTETNNDSEEPRAFIE
jgi:hypothetical protein